MNADLDLKSPIARRALAIDWAIRSLPPGAPIDGIQARAKEFEVFLMEPQGSGTKSYVFGENLADDPKEFT